MSAVTIQVSPEMERQLRQAAAARGMDLDSYLALRVASVPTDLGKALHLLAEAGELLRAPANAARTERTLALLEEAARLLKSAWASAAPSEGASIAPDTARSRGSVPAGGTPDEDASSDPRSARDPWRGLPRRRPEDLDELARAQGAPLAVRYEDLKAGFWPEEESAEARVAAVRLWRREGATRGS